MHILVSWPSNSNENITHNALKHFLWEVFHLMIKAISHQIWKIALWEWANRFWNVHPTKSKILRSWPDLCRLKWTTHVQRDVDQFWQTFHILITHQETCFFHRPINPCLYHFLARWSTDIAICSCALVDQSLKSKNSHHHHPLLTMIVPSRENLTAHIALWFRNIPAVCSTLKILTWKESINYCQSAQSANKCSQNLDGPYFC